jgi:hypothetical protein
MAVSVFPGATNRVAEFTSSGTWVCPSGVYSAEFLVVGAGGGGGGCSNSVATNSSTGGGGGGGAVKRVRLGVTPGSSYTITIGAKGTGGAIASAGGNGGYSEIVLSGTTLIRSYGGMGGNGITALDANVIATLTKTLAGTGGQGTSSTTNRAISGGGGGAFLFALTTDYALGRGTEGGYAAAGSITFGRIGIDGFGAGGGGAQIEGTTVPGNAGAAPYGAGEGATTLVASTGPISGGAALANNGSGGGGGLSCKSTTGATGGNGSDGIVRIFYVA